MLNTDSTGFAVRRWIQCPTGKIAERQQLVHLAGDLRRGLGPLRPGRDRLLGMSAVLGAADLAPSSRRDARIWQCVHGVAGFVNPAPLVPGLRKTPRPGPAAGPSLRRRPRAPGRASRAGGNPAEDPPRIRWTPGSPRRSRSGRRPGAAQGHSARVRPDWTGATPLSQGSRRRDGPAPDAAGSSRLPGRAHLTLRTRSHTETCNIPAHRAAATATAMPFSDSCRGAASRSPSGTVRLGHS